MLYQIIRTSVSMKRCIVRFCQFHFTIYFCWTICFVDSWLHDWLTTLIQKIDWVHITMSTNYRLTWSHTSRNSLTCFDFPWSNNLMFSQSNSYLWLLACIILNENMSSQFTTNLRYRKLFKTSGVDYVHSICTIPMNELKISLSAVHISLGKQIEAQILKDK